MQNRGNHRRKTTGFIICDWDYGFGCNWIPQLMWIQKDVEPIVVRSWLINIELITILSSFCSLAYPYFFERKFLNSHTSSFWKFSSPTFGLHFREQWQELQFCYGFWTDSHHFPIKITRFYEEQVTLIEFLKGQQIMLNQAISNDCYFWVSRLVSYWVFINSLNILTPKCQTLW